MRKLSKNDIQRIIEGANLLGTGGGGTITGATSILNKIKKQPSLISIRQLKNTDVVCTVFGIGGKQNCDPIIASKNALSLFQKVLNTKISAIIPVEVGAMAIANAMFIASELNIPLLDSDIVGLRSSPEVFLETITLANLERTPCAIADDKGNQAVLWKSENLQKLEQFFRNFAISVGGDAFIAGYPLSTKELKGVVFDGSITTSLQTGNAMQKLKNKEIDISDFCKQLEWKLLATGKIIKTKNDTTKGFTQGLYTITSQKNTFTVIFKNENIVVLKEKNVVLTSPDSISLLDLSTIQAINNFEENTNTDVAILGKKAIPLWRTIKGKKLFSPKNLGLNYQQILL